MSLHTLAGRQGSLRDACDGLFAAFPLAVDRCGGRRWVTLLLADDSGPAFYRLQAAGGADYAICRWDSDDPVITPVPVAAGLAPAMEAAIRSGVPLPRAGAMFGWACDGSVTALLLSYADEDVPAWSLLPRAGLPQDAWPPFAGELLGSWFWEHYQAGRIVDLAALVAGTRDAVFWVTGSDGLGVCAVAGDIASPDGWTLPQGVYAWHEVLRGGGVPSLGELLADSGKTDLAPRFQGC